MKNISLLIVTVLLFCFCKTEKDHDLVDGKLIYSSEIHLRDPFIFVDQKSRTYYLYTSIHNRTMDYSQTQGVEVYTSKDLQNWTSPKPVFQIPEGFWATKYVWAPEVHFYNGKYYLFVTFTSDDLLENPVDSPTDDAPVLNKRGTQVLVSDHLEGPFEPFKNGPHTYEDWMTIDGTFWLEDGQPYMVYCHEWTQIFDGTIDLIALKDDLSDIKGDNQVLFKGSEAPWPKVTETGYMTDGCYLYKTDSGELLMIWSSGDDDGFSIGISRSESGSVKGPWTHQSEPLFAKKGLHAMIFKTLEGNLTLAVHQPNISPNERMQFFKLKDTGDSLEIDGKLF